MRRSAASFLLLIPICSFFLIAHARQLEQHAADRSVTASCIPKERDALLDFKHGINDTGNLLVSWQGQDCCLWVGVTCGHQTGNILRLDLSDATFDGGLLEGQQISPSLISLEHLEYLDLSAFDPMNSNSSNPDFLGSMKNLRHLSLSGLCFSGSLPPQLANLSKLEYFDLSWASFSGRVLPELGNLSNLQHLDLSNMEDMYSKDISWLTRLNLLEYLDMSFVNLSMVDWPHVLNMIPSLKVLCLANCNLPRTSQTLAHLNLTKLVQLDLSSNYLGHPVSSCWFWNVTSIESLELSETHLFGPFPSALGSLKFLQRFGFSNNGNALQHVRLGGSLLSGNIKDLVDKLPRCKIRAVQRMTRIFSRLFHLELSNNNLTGEIPVDIPDIVPSLEYLDLSGNNITGAIPQTIKNCTSLDTLILRSNQLIGQIPTLPRKLSWLDLSTNFLSGPFPLDFGATDLEALIVSSNQLTGQIPRSICASQYMLALDLGNNFLDGTIPQCLQISSMLFLLLSDNNLSGILPSFPNSSTTLAYIDLSWNTFNGTLPVWISDMSNLRFLQLSHNMFHGHIPGNITSLTNLRYLDLACNNISGAIPGSLSNLIAMTEKHFDFVDWFESYTGPGDDQFGGILSVMLKRQELNYGDRIDEVVGIDLSLNHLTGRIPDEITCLNRLLNLNLSWNQLTGNIDNNIGAMKTLESLDLSCNNLSGELPSSLADLTYLSYLDLSYNNFTGRIPSGRQLDTLYTEHPSMYNGNNGLCGPPLQRSCLRGKLPENGNEKTGKIVSKPMAFYFGLGSGFMFGLWIVFCVILFKRTWRAAYFHLFDKLCDRVYVFFILSWGCWN